MATLTQPLAVVIEDDGDVAELLQIILVQAGFEVFVAATATFGLQLIHDHEPRLETVDNSLPDADAIAVVQQVRRISDTYLVMIGSRTTEDDIIIALDAGADDYVAKPFRPRELRSRLGAGLRRPLRRVDGPHAATPEPSAGPAPQPAAPPADTVGAPASSWTPPAATPVVFLGEWIEFRGLQMNPTVGIVALGGQPIELNPLQFDLLEIMLYSGGEVRAPLDLALSLRGERYHGDENPERDHDLVTQAMHQILLALDDLRHTPRWIEQVPGGYRLVPPV